MDEETSARIERLVYMIRELAGWAGVDLSELIEQEYLKEGDLR